MAAWANTRRSARGERKDALLAHIAGGGAGWRVGTVVTQYSLPDTLELARHAGQAGADHIVLMRPSGGLTEDELGDYAETVIAAAGLPGVLFDRVPRAGRLAGSGHPAIGPLRRHPRREMHARPGCQRGVAFGPAVTRCS